MMTRKIFFALLLSFALPFFTQCCKSTICSQRKMIKILKSKLDSGHNPEKLAQELQQELEGEKQKESRYFEAVKYGRKRARKTHPGALAQLLYELHSHCLEKNKNCENLTIFAAHLMFGKDWEHLEETLQQIFLSQKNQ